MKGVRTVRWTHKIGRFLSQRRANIVSRWRECCISMAETRGVRGVSHVVGVCEKNPFPIQVLFVLLYRLSLDLVYLWQLSPNYAYSNFTTDLYLPRYLLSLVVLIAFSPLVARLQQDEHPSSIMITLICYTYFIPLTSYCGCKGASLSFFLIAVFYCAWMIALQFCLPIFLLKPQENRFAKHVFPVLTVLFSLFVLYISGKYTGFRMFFDVINVYGVRAEAASYELSTAANYFLSFCTVVLSFAILYWLQKKNVILVFFLLFIYFLYYSIGAHKAVFLFMVLLLGCWFVYREWMLRWMGALLCITTITTGIISAMGNLLPMSVFVRRMMILPVQISESYMNFFSQHTLNLFRDGFMGKASFSPIYTTTIPRIIGEFRGTPYSNCNNGLLGDLFANVPTALGLLLMPLILVLCFRLLDFVSKDRVQKLLFPICVLFAMSFINGSWSTALLSDGYLLACLLLYFFPRKECIESQ